MLQCGGCSVQQVSQAAQVLLNPVTWMAVVGVWYAMTGVTAKKKGGKK